MSKVEEVKGEFKTIAELSKGEEAGLSNKDMTSKPAKRVANSPEDEILMYDTQELIKEYYNEGVMTLELAKAYITLFEIGDIQQVKYINKILTKKYGKRA